MKNAKLVFMIFAVAIVLLFAGHHHLYAAGGLPGNPWAVNDGAQGDKGTGTLTMYGEVVDPADSMQVCGDTEIKMYFFLRLNFGKTEKIYSRVSNVTHCHPSDYSDAETLALHEFLRQVADELKPGIGYSACTPDPFDDLSPEFPCPNILWSFKNPLDSESEFNNQGRPLSIVGPVILKIP